MARRWTPQRFAMHRRLRVAACAAAVTVASVLSFGIGARKSVALDINGETTTVTTYAMSVDRLLAERGIDVKTHDLVQSTSGTNELVNHDVVTVRSAFQTTITIDGAEVPFWTVATSADQLLGFFASSEQDAAKVTVDIKNVYNQLTGGFVINASGPVTVIADGKSSVAPDGRLPAVSILDAKGITLGKDDRVSVEKNGDETILRVKRVAHGTLTETETIAHGTQTVIDDSLAPGTSEVRRQGEDGEKTNTYDATFVDGDVESKTLTDSKVTRQAVDTIIAVGPAAAQPSESDSASGDTGDASGNASDGADSTFQGTDSSGASASPSASPSAPSAPSDESGSATPEPQPSETTQQPDPSPQPSTPEPTTPEPSSPAPSSPAPSTDPTPDPQPSSGSGNNNGGGSSGGSDDSDQPPSGASREEIEQWYEQHNRIPQSDARLWHPTVAQAKTYARGAAAQRGWTDADWDALETLWTKESSWHWYSDNPTSSAYGIPQGLPGWDMGYGWQDDGAVQIDWGLKYIAQRYGTPSKAWEYWQRKGWY